MSNHLFPVKMAGIIKRLMYTNTFINRKSPADTVKTDDDKLRIMLYSSEVNHAISTEPDFKDLDQYGLRKRIAIPQNATFLGLCEGVMFEVYDINGDLIKSQPLCQVRGYLAAAIEVELLVMLIKELGEEIIMM